MNVAAEENRVGWLGGTNGVEHALSRGRIAVPGVGPVANLPFAIFLMQLGDKLFLGDDVPGSAGLLEAIKQPLLLLSAEQRSIAIRALRTTVRRHVASAQWRYFAGLFAPVLPAIQNREGHKAAKSKALIKAQCVDLRYRPRA